MAIRTFKPEYILPGTRIGRYVVCSQIGQGSGAVVYDVVSEDGAHYALKVSRFPPGPSPFDTSSMMAKRFERGIHCHRQLSSCPHVARIIGHGWHPGRQNGWPYIVQELVPGSQSITDWAKEDSPSLRKIVTAFEALASTCGEMARLDIHHRDLKPANILMMPDGAPKIVDFNSATHFQAEPLTYPAASGQPGTVIYQPPELCRAILQQQTTGQEAAFTPRPSGDLHALGCILYEVLVGEHPYDLHENSVEQLKEIAYRETPIPQILNEGIPLGLTKVVMGLLRKDPEQRYQHGDQVAKDLRALLEVADESWDRPFVVPREEGPKHHLLRRQTDPVPAPRSPTPEALPPPPEPPRRLVLARRPRIRWARVGVAAALIATGYLSGRIAFQASPVSMQRPPEAIVPATPVPPPSGPLVGKPKREDGETVAAGPSDPVPGKLSAPAVALVNEKARPPVTATAPLSGRLRDELVAAQGQLAATRSALYDALKRERALSEENARLKRDDRSFDHALAILQANGEEDLSIDGALATLLAEGRPDLTPLTAFRQQTLRDDGVVLKVTNYQRQNPKLDMKKSAVVFTVTNGGTGPWELDEVRLMAQPYMQARPFAMRQAKVDLVAVNDSLIPSIEPRGRPR